MSLIKLPGKIDAMHTILSKWNSSRLVGGGFFFWSTEDEDVHYGRSVHDAEATTLTGIMGPERPGQQLAGLPARFSRDAGLNPTGTHILHNALVDGWVDLFRADMFGPVKRPLKHTH